MRFGRRGLPELVHAFSIDPLAVPFISDKPLRAPALQLPTPPRSPPTPPHPAAEKSPKLSAPRPQWATHFEEPPVRQPLSCPRGRRAHGLPLGPGRRWSPLAGTECQAEVRQDRRGNVGTPTSRASGDRALPRAAPGRPSVATGSPRLSPALCATPISGRARRGGVAPQEPYVNPGVGWVGRGKRRREINLFGWSRVRVSRFPYPGIAGGVAIGSEDHVGP